MEPFQTASQRAVPLDDGMLREMYRVMLLSRRLDERAWALHRQGRVAFHVSAIGHEALQVAAAFALNRGVDYVVPYYRDLTLSLALGMTALDFLLGLFAKRSDPSSGGRQMPSHWSSRALNLVSTSAVVATQVTQAAGLAFAIQYKQRLGLADPANPSQPRLAFTSLGEGATSQGEWHEAMNWAGVHQLPFICLVENNQYAISVKVSAQMPVPRVADRAAAYGVHGVSTDGMDVPETYQAMRAAVERAYNGGGATLVEARTYRITPHSSDDDDRSYRSREEVETWKARDPLPRFRDWLIGEGLITTSDAEALDSAVRAEVDRAQTEAESAPLPSPEDALGPVYAPAEKG